MVTIQADRNIPFCYPCYRIVLSGVCTFCGSDDLMRLSFYYGCDYGFYQNWLKRIRSDASPIDISRAFEEFVRDSYPEEFKIGWMNLETVECMKTMDPFSWIVEMNQWVAQNLDEGIFITFDSGKTYYYLSDLEGLDQSSIPQGSTIPVRSTVDAATSKVISEPNKNIQNDLNI